MVSFVGTFHARKGDKRKSFAHHGTFHSCIPETAVGKNERLMGKAHITTIVSRQPLHLTQRGYYQSDSSFADSRSDV